MGDPLAEFRHLYDRSSPLLRKASLLLGGSTGESLMHKLLLVPLTALLAISPAQAKTHAAALKWMDGLPGLPSGSQFAVVSGYPGKAGPIVIRAKFPADCSIPSHHHPTIERLTFLTVTLHHAMSYK